ncbi:MAG: hypothetical protein WBA39_09255, partial [Rivularia sp. (in: cyanobacteria)]
SLKPFFDFGLMVEKVKQEQEEKTERLTVIEGLRKYACNHVLLIGRPGCGKSTALLRVLLETSPQTPLLQGEGLNSPHSLADLGENEQIPILVELRFYKISIIDLIRDFLKRHQLKLEINEIEKLLFAGKFILLIDGVNELPSEAARQDLQKFRQDYQQTTPMIFTTRDLGVGGDLGIEKKLQMQPLTETQMREFVCGYLSEQGEELLKQLEGRLRELGETPLLLMMLCSVFASNQNKVPGNLGSVFRHFTEIYDNKFKQDIPVTDESRRWWKRLLQHLAWVMTDGGTSPQTPLLKGEGLNSPHSLVGKGAGGLGFLKTEILVAIPIQEARDILTKFLKEQDYHQPRDAEAWLDDLLKYHLIQLGAENQIQFRHQLLQEYYAAERLLEEILKLNDDELQWEYLNYLKWTEVVALMSGLLEDEAQVINLLRLALDVDCRFCGKLVRTIKQQFQEQSVEFIFHQHSIPLINKIIVLGETKSDYAIPYLIAYFEAAFEAGYYLAQKFVIKALENIGSDAAVYELLAIIEEHIIDLQNLQRVLQNEFFDICSFEPKILAGDAVQAIYEIFKLNKTTNIINIYFIFLESENILLQSHSANELFNNNLINIDSCHAQGMATSKDDAGNNKRSPIPKGFTQTALPKTIIDNLKGTGRVVFTSSTGEQLSWIRSDRTMSIYTYHFLEALQGAGNQAGDKVVKISHLMNYLSDTVPSTTQQEYNKEQTPFFDFATEDFPVALLLGGKGLPQQGYESVKAEENIRSISNQVKDGVGIVGDGNIGFNIGTAGNITFGDISSK